MLTTRCLNDDHITLNVIGILFIDKSCSSKCAGVNVPGADTGDCVVTGTWDDLAYCKSRLLCQQVRGLYLINNKAAASVAEQDVNRCIWGLWTPPIILSDSSLHGGTGTQH